MQRGQYLLGRLKQIDTKATVPKNLGNYVCMYLNPIYNFQMDKLHNSCRSLPSDGGECSLVSHIFALILSSHSCNAQWLNILLYSLVPSLFFGKTKLHSVFHKRAFGIQLNSKRQEINSCTRRLKNDTCACAGKKEVNKKGTGITISVREPGRAFSQKKARNDLFLSQASKLAQGQGMTVRGKQLSKHHLLEASFCQKIGY